MKVGLIGCGGMGTVHNLSLKELSKQYDIQVTAVADCREEFLEKAAGQWSNVQKFKYGKDLIENADVDIVHICVPSYLHADLAIQAMEKGKNVFVEKPVCLSKEDCQRLLDTEKKTGVTVMVGQVVRCFDEYRFLKDAYDNKTYGKLQSIMMHRLSGDTTWGWEDWFHDINKSGSVILDLHIHDTDFLRYMIGEPDSYKVYATKFESGMPNQVVTTYEFGDTFAVVEGTWDISSKMPFEAYYRAAFEEATIVFSGLHEPHVSIYHKDGTVTIPEIKPEYDVQDDTAGINISSLGAYYTEIKYFIECLVNNKPIKIAPLSEGVKSVLLTLNELSEAMK
ncbi:Gfo/Idh/MocA family oxidoreductase [Anaerocolumna sedimenticola]|uniref:Gfo/Idh/MocA family oxidoreductase n=1 Tax=Anaerocolumna sedimenticola TaxID=2696063 RepID=A0A6P1TJN7_9FIRM|nr:Gfo/Idh/MocA family oxidoreductase [Anaerocolumna sedimenticola]QHQ60517.1 Gfo/Idh/MocA family oxidoreductase [Anaerocolumna sedimenticola]